MHAVADYLKPCRWRIVRVVSLKFAAAVLELLLPLLLAHIIDVSVPARNLCSVWGTGAVMAAKRKECYRVEKRSPEETFLTEEDQESDLECAWESL